MEKNKGVNIHITGIVQGVGFRPFIYNLAMVKGLKGWVKNTSSGLDIDVNGPESQLASFISRIKLDHPPLASIDQMVVTDHNALDFENFMILSSEAIPSQFQPISPDISVCPDCLSEMNNPNDRRFRYPFINCTNCGPRFTIIQDIPYDRSKTSMSVFEMCPECTEEYQDPSNRRFHAQPIACPTCGPKIWLEEYHSLNKNLTSSIAIIGEDAIQQTRKLIMDGKIIAIKGLGGFHLACDAKNPKAVAELRKRKLRVDKPFAVMMPDIETVRRHCHINETEIEFLESPAHPIVLLRRRSISMISSDVAPGQKTVGVMLPYTPLHHLLIEKQKGFPDVLVMTSGNLTDEPICTDNVTARERLSDLADAFLMHDRDIFIRTDDSVMRVFEKESYPIRRSRGYAPFPVQIPKDTPKILAVGAELKNTFCLTNNNYAFLSHHIGDLENYETLSSFESGISHFEHLFKVKPELIACDLHPDYLSTRYAFERADREKIQLFGIQHHHAHIASVIAEHGLDSSRRVIGIGFDGTGYGTDGAIWGGEFLVADYLSFQRINHLPYFQLPGGEISIRRPSRTALSLLYMLGIDWQDGFNSYNDLSELERKSLFSQLNKNINAPQTSSAGRLFDAVASLAGVRQNINYEAQAAIEFEAVLDQEENGCYEFEYDANHINLRNGIRTLLDDIKRGDSVGKISGKFHNGLARLVVEGCIKIRNEQDISEVALSGGVWQNVTLLQKTVKMLKKADFLVYTHRLVPANDGGLALGQAAIAAAMFNRR